jgi:glycosyltransferase involved in cell wall biosynthesis
MVVADGAPVDCRPLADAYGASVLEIAGPSGPAVARNRGARIASGDVLVFVDSDVVVAPQAVARLRDLFEQRPQLAAVFGAYDERPAEPNFVSQYKNLAHSFIHQSSNAVAHTFWAGFGAVRATVFAEVGGFDERFKRPCIEDIDLGYRLTAAGHEIHLDHQLRACHLKRWTWRSMIVSDVQDRGIPWTQLILRFGQFRNDLNLKSSYRACVAISYVLPVLLVLSLFNPWFLAGIAGGLAFLVHSGRRFYRFFVRQRGLTFAVRVFPLHYVYHLYNGFSFAVGSSLFVALKWFGIRLPGALPLTPWTGPVDEAAFSVLTARRATPAPRVPVLAAHASKSPDRQGAAV